MHACHSLIELQKRQLRILKRYNTISFPWTFRRDILDTLRAVLCCAVLRGAPLVQKTQTFTKNAWLISAFAT